MKTPSEAVASLNAAKAAILTLRAALPLASRGKSVLLFRGTLWPESRVRSELAAMVKPVRCVVSNADGLLRLECEESSQFRPFPDWRDSHPIRRALEVGSSNESTLLVGAGRSMVLTHSGLRAWLADYIVTTPLTISGDYAGRSQQKRGVSWVLHIWPAAEIVTSVDDLKDSDAVRDAIREHLARATKG